MKKLIFEGEKMRKPAESEKEPKTKVVRPSNKAGKAANK